MDDLIPADEVPPDPVAVAALLEQMPAPLTASEVERLHDIARRSAEVANEASELVYEVALRASTTPQGESDLRMALFHYYMALYMPHAVQLQRENLTVN